MAFLLETVAVANALGRLQLKCEKCISPGRMHNEGGDFQGLDSQTQADLLSVLETWKSTSKIWKNRNKYSSFSCFHSGSYRDIRGALCSGSHMLECAYERESVWASICICVCVRVWLCIRICEYMSVWECVSECLSIFKSMLVRGYVCESMCERACIGARIGAEIFISFESKSIVYSTRYDTCLFLAFFR